VLDGASPATDIGALQATAPAGSLFQVASQFNCLEAPYATVTDIADYFHDSTQGPRASISAFPGTFVRHYAAPGRAGTRFVQTTNGRQLNLLDELCGKILDYVKRPHAPQPAIAVTDAPSAYRDMEATLGLVPSFFKQFPEAGIAGAWREFKTIQLNPHSALPGKYKELIGLAVAAQIPCRYCILFHTEAARLNGASDAEIREAVAMASVTRHWSTFLNGMLTDEGVFRRETDQVIANVRRKVQLAAH
jgi:AhpD family alkylhydroperoxidase